MNSDNGFLSQEEIDALLNGGSSSESIEESSDSNSGTNVTTENAYNENSINTATNNSVGGVVSNIEKDLLGEIGNISMGSASTALSTVIGQPVNITTPKVEVTTLKELKGTFEVPNIALEVEYTSGIVGQNLLIMKIPDAAIIADLMMGGDGKPDSSKELTEIEESAVSEAMNQMIGSAATSMATMFAREVNISPPKFKIWEDVTFPLTEDISEDEDVIRVSFNMKIGNLVDSTIMQILPQKTAKKIVSIMMGQEEVPQNTQPQQQLHEEIAPKPQVQPKPPEIHYEQPTYNSVPQPEINVQKASFQPLKEVAVNELPKNIDLILDVPLEISVVLGKAKMNIKDVLNLGNGSLVELDRLAEEPVEILVNGKKVAYGEVVVVDENFGVRIVNIVSGEERVRTLGGK
ncbi:flagellar motor switch phosphatase FliY [Clostridium aestuarii]|uniref:Flagellar motor switch phosphatase FliY n=1 Tax=Clostridium aestuarii TaxID=338193 RepID=A0ABT4CZ31_9CLOT|nr:flagellar motor switch phosphatase FliY [Clostridium aestuarii]MCY6483652.1 flagellar motor switch phosphatase FliY [Clostridium aestuarii]